MLQALPASLALLLLASCCCEVSCRAAAVSDQRSEGSEQPQPQCELPADAAADALPSSAAIAANKCAVPADAAAGPEAPRFNLSAAMLAKREDDVPADGAPCGVCLSRTILCAACHLYSAAKGSGAQGPCRLLGSFACAISLVNVLFVSCNCQGRRRRRLPTSCFRGSCRRAPGHRWMDGCYCHRCRD